ncbi:DUF3626 domain-containing protein [Streptomyces tsukubensis]|uniref:DUF3626 domain-containing protein n=1 Tax=Streptomyces tsukubensis TaxID=83656 RepID=A0A1V4ABS7_9ACTN|nr:DUF3626 domain-containing protein [Streptomyces tsukubensis]OON80864.1 hypothetical protein B1H18_10800 [Streptomyces tsukubensis]QFR93494.1 DUF3626 domain-containing protein [Streptomyces tsukubensis]
MHHVTGLATGPALDPSHRLTLNFHPDRATHGVQLLAALAEGGVYRSQFVTGTSNGGLTARPGGDRWRWESRIFGGAYDGAAGSERPVYGALNYRGAPVGAAPRFGSAHFRLAASALERATFCYPDSAAEPTDFGVAARMGLIELAEAARRDQRVDHLDDYIEAQVHGPVVVARDVEALVLDPCYRGTEVEEAARALPCPLEWHGGYRLSVRELRLHPEYRGARITELGALIAEGGRLDPAVIGAAVHGGAYEPQDLKKVWHCLARFGRPGAPLDSPLRTASAPA